MFGSFLDVVRGFGVPPSPKITDCQNPKVKQWYESNWTGQWEETSFCRDCDCERKIKGKRYICYSETQKPETPAFNPEDK